MSWKKEIDEIKFRKSIALKLGGKDKVIKQHNAGRLTVRERISYLLDKDSFNEVGILAGGSTNPETGELTPKAKIAEEFVKKNPDGSYDYEIIDIGNGKGRNILKYDLDKIERKVTPFINAEVAGLLTSEQSVVAAWNVFIGADTSVSEDDQMAQNANAGFVAWSYDEDLPLQQDKKDLFMEKYKKYFMHNYLQQFTKNQLPSVAADAVPFETQTEEVKETAEKAELEPQN